MLVYFGQKGSYSGLKSEGTETLTDAYFLGKEDPNFHLIQVTR